MNEDLSRYLQALTAEGVADSEGEFQVDAVRALRMTSARLFSDPAAPLLKLVQAAVAAGASEIHFKVRASTLEMSFDSELFGVESLRDLPQWLPVLDARLPGRPWQHLLRGLQALQVRPGQRLLLALQDSQGGLAYQLHGDEVQVQPLPRSQTEVTRCALTISHGSGPKWLIEKSALRARASFSPAPLSWNGKRIRPLVLAAENGSGRYPWLVDRLILARDSPRELLTMPHLTELAAPLYDLGGAVQDLNSDGATFLHQWRCFRPGQGAPLYELHSQPEFRLSRSSWWQNLLGVGPHGYALNHGVCRSRQADGQQLGYQILWVNGLSGWSRAQASLGQGRFGSVQPLAVRAWARVPRQPEAPGHRLWVIQDGVVLDPIRLSGPLAGARIFVADNQLATDLSGLVAREDDRLVEVLHWISRELERSRQELRASLRWNEKHRLSDAWVAQVREIHKLEDVQPIPDVSWESAHP